MIDFNIITIWTLFLISFSWVLSVHGIWYYKPLMMMSPFIFAVTYLIRIGFDYGLPTALDIKNWEFYYG